MFTVGKKMCLREGFIPMRADQSQHGEGKAGSEVLGGNFGLLQDF